MAEQHHAKVPQMQRKDNAYQRMLLRADDVESTAKTLSKDSVDADFALALARRQARLDSTSSSRGSMATSLELTNANDRVALLERQLLDAEETICHLKAEKLAALRDVERLSGKNQTEDGDTQRRLVLELEKQLQEQTQAQEQHLAVIRDQELELKTLQTELTDRTTKLTELQQRHLDLLEMDDPPVQQTLIKQSVTSSISQFSICGEESDEDDEAKGTKPLNDGIVGRARAPARADAVSVKWHEELVRHPTPHFDLQSPEVAYILRAWTTNIKKMRYLRRWLIQVVTTNGPLPEDFPMAVELPRLPPEVRDGFLTLVLPLLRKQTKREILAHSRRYNDGVHTDLRFRVVPRE